MTLVTKVAYFKMCTVCGKHGNIVCPNGAEGACFSKMAARVIAKQAQNLEHLTPEEMPELLRQIDASPLPEQTAVILMPPPPCISVVGTDATKLPQTAVRPMAVAVKPHYIHPQHESMQ